MSVFPLFKASTYSETILEGAKTQAVVQVARLFDSSTDSRFLIEDFSKLSWYFYILTATNQNLGQGQAKTAYRRVVTAFEHSLELEALWLDLISSEPSCFTVITDTKHLQLSLIYFPDGL